MGFSIPVFRESQTSFFPCSKMLWPRTLWYNMIQPAIAQCSISLPSVRTVRSFLRMIGPMSLDLHGFTWIYMDLHGFTATKIQQRSKGAKYWNKMKQDHAHAKACATDMHRSPKFEWHEALQLVRNTKSPGAMKNSMPLSVNLSLYSSLILENVPSSADFCPLTVPMQRITKELWSMS